MFAIRLQRFKGFKDSGWIELKPITLLFGYNSSGKSTILKALLMLKQSLENPAKEVPFVFSSDRGVDIGSYEDVVYMHKIDNNNPIIISMRVDVPASIRIMNNYKNLFTNMLMNEDLSIVDYVTGKNEPLSQIEFLIKISYHKTKKAMVITDFLLKDEKGNSILEMKRGISEDAKLYFISDYSKENIGELQLGWNTFLPLVNNEYSLFGIILNQVKEEITKTLQSLSNIGPLRIEPNRVEFFTGENPSTVGTRGQDAMKLLYLGELDKKKKGIEGKINEWLKHYNYRFKWEFLKTNFGQFVLIDTRTNLEVSIKDVGFGISQVLPVVIQVYFADRGDTLLLEQPEIHLHSQAQAELADLFLDAIDFYRSKDNGNKQKKRLIIETHSENLLLRLRRRIAENYLDKKAKIKADPNDIAIYFIENKNSTSIAHHLKINEKGEFVDLPDEFAKFFSDDFNEHLQINNTLGKIYAKENKEVS